MQPQRIPPHSKDSEQTLLGALLQRQDLFFECEVLPKVDDFYFQANRILFETISSMVERSIPVDIVTVSTELKSCNKLADCGGPAYISALSDMMPVGVEYHIKKIIDCSVLRKAITAGIKMVDMAYDGNDAHDVIACAEREIFDLGNNEDKKDFAHVSAISDRVMINIEERAKNCNHVSGLPTGFFDLDKLTSGFQPTDLIVLAARPGMGKTALGMNISINSCIETGDSVAVFSLEMSKEQLVQRNIASLAGVDSTSLRNGFVRDIDWPHLRHAKEKLAGLKIFIDDTAGLTSLEIKRRARKLAVKQKDLRLIVVDYLQFIAGKAETRNLAIGEMTRDMKNLAKELKLPVLLLSQLNRSLENRTNKRPTMSDLRESGSIEQDADVIVFIYRDEVYNKDPHNPRKGIAEIIIEKQRNGPIGTVELLWDGKTTTFHNFDKFNQEI